MPELRAITEPSHRVRSAASRLVERVYDLLWLVLRRPLSTVLLRDQRPLDDAEFHRANSIIDWIQDVIGARADYLERHQLSPAIHCPQAIWALDTGEGLYDG